MPRAGLGWPNVHGAPHESAVDFRERVLFDLAFDCDWVLPRPHSLAILPSFIIIRPPTTVARSLPPHVSPCPQVMPNPTRRELIKFVLSFQSGMVERTSASKALAILEGKSTEPMGALKRAKSLKI